MEIVVLIFQHLSTPDFKGDMCKYKMLSKDQLISIFALELIKSTITM